MVLHRHFHFPKNPVRFAGSSLLPKPLETTELSTVFTVLPFPEYYIVGIIQYTAISDWLLSLSDMHSGFLHVFSWLESLFLFSPEYIPLSGCVRVYPFAGCFQVLAIMNKVVTNIHVAGFCTDVSFQLRWVNTKE